MSEYLSTDINDFCFIDDETRALEHLTNPMWGSITTTSTGRYARSCKVIVITYAIGEGAIKEWVLEDFDKTLCWRDAPLDLCVFIKRVYAGEAWFVAFNSTFDMQTMNHGMVRDCKGPVIEVEHMLDAKVRASYSNLPQALDGAAKWCGHEGKQTDGKALIQLFCVAGGATPQSHPVEWERFKAYAGQDIETLRVVWQTTVDLPKWMWEEFWASERINLRGMPVDVDYVTAAAAVADAFKATVTARVKDITDEALYSIHQHAAIAQWVYDRVEEIPDGRATLVKRYDEETEGGELIPAKLGCDRNRTTRLIALLERQNEEFGLSDDEFDVLELLRLKEYGASATIGKFRKMVDAVMDNGRLPNQYVFNGAQQTGRFSSQGVQMHNLTRKTVADEAGLIEFILDVVENTWRMEEALEVLEEEWGDVGMALSRMVRVSISAEPGNTLVWGDWSNIEARVLPWLAMCEERLDVFRAVDKDPSNPDVYTISAAGMDKIDMHKLWKDYKAKEKYASEARQKGKIAELSLGFGGAAGALLSMAANYGMAFTEEEAKKIVADWRAANAWAVAYWDEVWAAFTSARSHPGKPFQAGRVSYLGVAGYFGDVSVFCILPDGRLLIYRDVRWEKREVEDGKTGAMVTKEQFTFGRGYSRVGLWYGILVENITQATAASILRRSLTELEYDVFPEMGGTDLIAHTHDEMIAECPDNPEAIAACRAEMHDSMAYVPPWAEGLPLAADMSTNHYYTKHED